MRHVLILHRFVNRVVSHDLMPSSCVMTNHYFLLFYIEPLRLFSKQQSPKLERKGIKGSRDSRCSLMKDNKLREIHNVL